MSLDGPTTGRSREPDVFRASAAYLHRGQPGGGITPPTMTPAADYQKCARTRLVCAGVRGYSPHDPAPGFIRSETVRVACDGSGEVPAALGHPRVYLHISTTSRLRRLRYCDRRFVLEGGPADCTVTGVRARRPALSPQHRSDEGRSVSPPCTWPLMMTANSTCSHVSEARLRYGRLKHADYKAAGAPAGRWLPARPRRSPTPIDQRRGPTRRAATYLVARPATRRAPAAGGTNIAHWRRGPARPRQLCRQGACQADRRRPGTRPRVEQVSVTCRPAERDRDFARRRSAPATCARSSAGHRSSPVTAPAETGFRGSAAAISTGAVRRGGWNCSIDTRSPGASST